MANKTLNVRIQNKYDTEANWASKNPVLLKGEAAYSSDKNGLYKIGDGTSKWSDLKYGLSSELDALTNNKSDFKFSHHVTEYTGTAYYTKLFELTADSTYINYNYEFAIAERNGGIAYVHIYLYSDNNKYFTDALIRYKTDSGYADFITGNMKGFVYKDTTKQYSKLEVWFKVNAWQDVRIMEKTVSDRGCKFTWASNFTRNAAFPTDATSIVEPKPQTVAWGNITGKPSTYYTHPSYTARSSGLYKVTVDATGHVSGATAVSKADITALGIPGTDTNTWRGVQNNLTSTATDQSLSAAQGKILNELTFQKKKAIDATVDWDTLKEFGCYKIQMASWGDAATKHSPNAYGNVYQFGLLLVFRGYDADTENRTVQIYIPHKADANVSSVVLMRMLNGTGWQAWHPIARGTGWSDIINKPTTFTPSSHTHDDRYYTESEINSKLATYLPLGGGTMTGNLAFSNNKAGISWARASDGASILFNAETDATDNYLEFHVTDDEAVNFKWTKTVGSENLTLGTWKREGIRLGVGSFIGSLTGNVYGNVYLNTTQSVIQNQMDTSNYTSPITWKKGGKGWYYKDSNNEDKKYTYDPQIGQHNTGNDGNGSIVILPYATNTSPWGGQVGLYIGKNNLKLDGNNVLHTGNYNNYSPTKTGGGASGTWGISVSGNSATTTKLITARSINGTNFDGTGNITTATWGTARNITIGSTKKSVNGSADVSWSLSEIGAAAASHSHSYLPLNGGTLTGALNISRGSVDKVSPTSQDIVINVPSTDETKKSPGIGFHVAGKNYATLKYLSDGSFRFYNSTLASYVPVYASFYGNLSGNATTATNVAWSGVTGKPSTFTPSSHTHNQYYDSGISRAANTVLAAPNGANGTATFRKLVAADIPTLTKSKISDFPTSLAPTAGSNNYVRVYNSKDIGNSSTVTFNDLAKQHFAMGMINGATDNPYGAAKWAHGISMAWSNGANTSWISQIALGVQEGTGMWYRTSAGSGTIVGRTWNRVLDSSNYTSYAATKGHTHDLSTMINTLTTGTSAPTDSDYYVTQYAGGGTTTTSYHRRPHSALWTYIKSKADAVYQPKGSYAAANHTHSYLPLSGGTMNGHLYFANGTNYYINNSAHANFRALGTAENTYVPFPQGGGFRTTASVNTGYLKITLPQSWSSTMISFKVKIYEYRSDTSCEYTISGYNYTAESAWKNCTACSIGKNDTKTVSNLAVRFGHDGSKCAVYIGNADTKWNYVQVQVCDIVVGYTNYEYSKWASGWSVGFTTTLGTITQTKTNPNVSRISTAYDIGNGNGVTFAYSKSGMNYADYTWLAGWNGYELRAVAKSQFATAGHTHNYAGSSSAGGAATSANKLNTNAGSATQPVYFNNGIPVACTYTLGKSVPTDAKFTDTTYSNMTAATASAAGKAGLAPAPAAGKQGQFLRGDGTWATPTNTTYSAGRGIALSSTIFKLADTCTSITDWNSATTTGWYMGSGAANGPTTANNVWYFGMVIAHNTNYLVQEVYQFTASTSAISIPKYIRAKTNGTWGAWTEVTVQKKLPSDAKFTDTVYTHPNSGVTAGTYKSVTVNAQGHVTSGSNPTTLAGYGITDAAAKTHTHNYAGSSSAGGSANSAVKLATARTVSGGTDITMNFNYDGSANSTANIGFYACSASVGNTNNYPFHRFAKLDTITGSYVDKASTFYISQDYQGGNFGIVRIVLRTNNSSSVSAAEVRWLVRSGLAADSVQVGIYNVNGKTYADAFFKTQGAYASTVFRAIANGARGSIARTWTLINSAEGNNTTASDAKTSTECYVNIATAATKIHKQAYSTTVSGSDSGTVSYSNNAGSANSVAWANVSGKPTIVDKTTRTLTSVGTSGWKDAATDQKYVPDMAFIAYWNGAYSNTSSNLAYCNKGAFGTIVTKNAGDYATAGHTHHYAGSSSAGGSATSAVKLDTSTAGSATQPVYFTGGKPVACTYTLGKSVPSNAVFTDTNNKMTQTAITSKDYTNWRTILWGASNSGKEGFTPTTVTDGAFTDTNLSYQPSTGTLRAKVFKGDLYQTTTIGNSTATECSLNFLSNAKLSDGSYLAQNYRIVNDRKTDFVFGIKTKNNEWASYCQGTQVYFKNSSADISALAGKMLPPVLTDFSGSKDSPGAGTGRVLSIASNVDSKIIKFRIFTSSTATTATTVNVTYSTSDIRLKDNVKDTDVKDALSVINKMKIRQFDWKDDNKHQKIGFVADELEELDDKLVVGGGWEDEEHTQMNVKGVDTFYMMGYVVKGMQELSEQIKALTEENKELKRQIEGLKREG